ncbi:alpha/beta hydrolase [Microbacterium sp. LWO12-1.2]|uniref:alpha/beta hydrolase n=1 Tax=Microbacterium sp. LWO12-1.2 TaxID=3135261 RepID=UPI0034169630
MNSQAPVTADAGAFLAIVKDAPPLDTQSAAQNRADLEQALPLTGVGAEVAHVEDTEIAGVKVRIHAYSDEPNQPCIVYFHGGGWVIGDPDLADSTTRDLAVHAQATVVSVDYRRAPENPFPAAHEDALAVTQALLSGSTALPINPDAVAVAGDSAGGNLAAGVALKLRHADRRPVHQVLIYPNLDWDMIRESEAWRLYGEGYFLTARDLEYFYANYAPNADGADGGDLRLNPGKATDLAGLPKALVITAECDPIRDSGEDYARRLSDAGVETTCVRFQGQVHPFFFMGGIIKDALAARRFVGAELRATFTEVAATTGAKS